MIDIWKYEYEDNIRLTTFKGDTYEGNIINIFDAEEMEDETEDELALEQRDGKIIGFKESEIKKIEKF